MNKIKVICIWSVVTMLSSCGAYRKYSPITKVDENLFGTEYTTSDTISIATLSWKELFTDTYLTQLIDTALVRNTDLKTAHLRTEQAEAVLLNAQLSYLPTIGIVADGGVNYWNDVTSKPYSIGATASWEIDVFGKTTAVKRGAAYSLEASQAYTQAVQTRLIATVASTYYTLLMLDEQLEINEQTLQNWEQTISTLRVLMRAGRANEAAVLQAEANKKTLEAAVLSIGKSRTETENALCALLAQTPMHVERGALNAQVFPDTLSAGVPLQLLANRPDVRQAEASLAKAFYATNVARAAFYPSISLSGSAGWTNSGGGVVLNPANWLLNAIGSLVQPLFNRGTNIANLRIAKAEQEIATLAFQQKLLDAGHEVNNALIGLQTARERLVLNSESVNKLSKAVRTSELLMKHSSANYLEVLTAQQALLTAQQALAQDKFDEINSIIILYHAVGGGTQ